MFPLEKKSTDTVTWKYRGQTCFILLSPEYLVLHHLQAFVVIHLKIQDFLVWLRMKEQTGTPSNMKEDVNDKFVG